MKKTKKKGAYEVECKSQVPSFMPSFSVIRHFSRVKSFSVIRHFSRVKTEGLDDFEIDLTCPAHSLLTTSCCYA